MRKEADLTNRIVEDGIGIPDAYYVHCLPLDCITTWDCRALAFSSHEAAEAFADSWYVKGAYQIIRIHNYDSKYGYINADGLILERHDYEDAYLVDMNDEPITENENESGMAYTDYERD